MVLAAVVAVLPGGRALVAMNRGSLQLTSALLRESTPDRQTLADAEASFQQAASLAPGWPAPLRDLARAHLARFDTTGFYGDEGPRWRTDDRSSWGFTARHPVGM